jgi:hypothetical protein
MTILKKFVPIFILLLISVGIIFYQFPNIPKNLSFDEVDFAKLALSLNGKPYIPYSTLATGHATLYFYIILLSFKLFGVTNFALRFPSAIFGVLSIITFFFLMKLVFNNRTIKPFGFTQDKQSNNNHPPNTLHLTPNFFALILSIIFVTSHWYFNFARFSFEATFLVFLELTSLYFIISWLNHPSISLRINPQGYMKLILSGIFAGLAYNSYTPGRIFFLIPLSFVVLLSLRAPKGRGNLLIRLLRLPPWRDPRNDMVRTIFLFLVPFLIVILPLTFYIFTHKDDRVDKQFFPKNTEMKLSEKVDFFTKNITSIALMFNFKGDINGRHNYPGKPALNPILGILFIVGLIISIKNYKNIYSLLFIIYYFIALIPATVTYPWENPNMLRTITAIPSIIYFMGISLKWIVKTIFPTPEPLRSRVNTRVSKNIVLFLILTSLFLSSIYELRTYFIYQTKVFKQAFEVKNSLPKAFKDTKN